MQAIAERDGAAPGSARVTSTDLASGDILVWQDSTVRLDDGTTGTAFVAAFRPLAGQAYRIEATPPEGGAVSSAEVRLPAMPALAVDVPTMIAGIISQRLTVASVERPRAATVIYTVRPAGQEDSIRVEVRYTATRVQTGFEVLVALSRDAGEILNASGTEVALLGLALSYDLTGERVAVTGGVGEIGSVAAFVDRWTLASEVVEALGLIDAQGG